MIHFENTIEIDHPIEEVFEFVAHMENVPKWNYYVTQVWRTSGSHPSIGATYHQVRQSDEQDFAIVDYQPNRGLTIRTTPGSAPEFTRTFTFEPIESGTRIVDTWELNTGRPAIIERLGAGQVKAAVAENLDKLKWLLETGEARLQDGRVSRA